MLAVTMASAIVALIHVSPAEEPDYAGREEGRRRRQHAAPLNTVEEDHFGRVSRSLNRMADPCTDFHSYVCANWEPPPKRAADFVAASEAEVERVLRSLGVPLRPRRWEILDRPLDVLVRLSLRAALPVTLLVEPTADLRSTGQMILIMARGHLYQQWAAARFSEDNKTLSAAAELIGGVRFARDVVSVESVVFRWFGDFSGSTPDTEYVSMRSLARRTPGIHVDEWLRAINQSPPVSVSADDDVYLFDPRGVELTRRIDVEFTDRRREVLRWIAAVVFHYLAPATSFNMMTRFRRSPQRSCFEYALLLAPYAVATQVAGRRVWPREARMAREVYARVRDVIRTSMADWVAAPVVRVHAASRVNALNAVLGLPAHLDSAAKLDAEYDYLERFHGVFIRDLLRSLKSKAARAARLFAESYSAPVPNLRAATFLGAPYPGPAGEEPYFMPYYHLVVVPPQYLLPPYVLVNSSAASYGGLGHLIGATILEAFDSRGLTLGHEGIRVDWLDATSREKWAVKRKCLLKRYNTGVGPFDAEYSRRTLDENYANVAGYEAALRAVKTDPRYRPRDESPVPGLNNEQLFYVSLCYKWCDRGQPSPGRGANGTTRTRPEHKCNIALPTVAGFTDAFGCEARWRDICDVL
ncbi:hypothetical protein HPB48_013965 [Haemaphysalis longicornis]|uniref:Peptidase M13 C-terminal domain-containing protein n=1 Tax=Haemaphysalis longicornis TaxID=44386 RepID=A0A9J6G867_HAELO|nr:hypothetical protein HPB48_013965 [Haemaphysalis longicornis]